MDNKNLVVHIANDLPIELKHLSTSLDGLSGLYKTFMDQQDYSPDYEPRLYINEVKNGSVILELSIAGISLLANEYNPLLQFISYLLTIKDTLLGKSSNPITLNKSQCENVKKFLDVTARDNNGN